MPASRILALINELNAVKILSTAQIMAKARSVKDVKETERVAKAARCLENAWFKVTTSKTSYEGRTELELASDIRTAMREEGIEEIAWCDVASVPNAAEPLHHGGGRRLSSGDLVVTDLAGSCDGYFGDICRTVSVGPAHSSAVEEYALVSDTLEMILGAIQPGMAAAEIDEIARSRLSSGDGPGRFTRRIGHGIGLALCVSLRVNQ